MWKQSKVILLNDSWLISQFNIKPIKCICSWCAKHGGRMPAFRRSGSESSHLSPAHVNWFLSKPSWLLSCESSSRSKLQTCHSALWLRRSNTVAGDVTDIYWWSSNCHQRSAAGSLHTNWVSGFFSSSPPVVAVCCCLCFQSNVSAAWQRSGGGGPDWKSNSMLSLLPFVPTSDIQIHSVTNSSPEGVIVLVRHSDGSPLCAIVFLDLE